MNSKNTLIPFTAITFGNKTRHYMTVSAKTLSRGTDKQRRKLVRLHIGHTEFEFTADHAVTLANEIADALETINPRNNN